MREFIDEVQQINSDWDQNTESKIRDYFRLGDWGQDAEWTDYAGKVFNIIHALCLLPFELQMKMRGYYRDHAPSLVETPPATTFAQLPAIVPTAARLQLDAVALA